MARGDYTREKSTGLILYLPWNNPPALRRIGGEIMVEKQYYNTYENYSSQKMGSAADIFLQRVTGIGYSFPRITNQVYADQGSLSSLYGSCGKDEGEDYQ